MRTAVVVLLLSVPLAARAEERQPELGRAIIDVDPIGGAAWFFFGPAQPPYGHGTVTLTNYLYKLNIDAAGRVARGTNASTYVGLGIKLGVDGGLVEAEPRFFVLLAMDRLHRPLVPFVRFSLGGEVDTFYRNDHNGAGQPILITSNNYGVLLEAGVGFHYFVTRHVGLGAEATFAFGPFVFPWSMFALYGDLILSTRFTF
jgi:hypothetical protein